LGEDSRPQPAVAYDLKSLFTPLRGAVGKGQETIRMRVQPSFQAADGRSRGTPPGFKTENSGPPGWEG